MGRPKKYKTLEEQRGAHAARIARWRARHPQQWQEIQDRAYAKRKRAA